MFGPLLFSAIIGIAVNANAITIRFYSPERVIMYVVFSYYIFLYIFHLIRSLDASQNRKKKQGNVIAIIIDCARVVGCGCGAAGGSTRYACQQPEEG